MPTSTVDLELNDISKHFGGVVALDHATLQCSAGEVHGVVGQNGAGKSTLVKVLSGVVQRDAGDIRLAGQTPDFHGPGDAIASGIGMLFQELSLLPDLKVSANIFFCREPIGWLGGIPQGALRRATLALFDQLGIEPVDPDAEIRTYHCATRVPPPACVPNARYRRSMVDRAHRVWYAAAHRPLGCHGLPYSTGCQEHDDEREQQ